MLESPKNSSKVKTNPTRPAVYRFRPLLEIGKMVSICDSDPPFRYTNEGAISMGEIIARGFAKHRLNGQKANHKESSSLRLDGSQSSAAH